MVPPVLGINIRMTMTMLQAHMEIASQMTRDISEEAEAAQDGKPPPNKRCQPKTPQYRKCFLFLSRHIPNLAEQFLVARLDLTRIDGVLVGPNSSLI